MLDDGCRGPLEVVDQRPGGLGVQQVVVRELQPLPLARAGQAPSLHGHVESGRLVWILPVAQVAQLSPADCQLGGQYLRRRAGPQVLGDRGVVSRRVGEGSRGQVPAERRAGSVRAPELLDHGGVVGRPHHREHVLVVLGGRAQ